MILLKPHAKLTLGAHRVQPEILFAISIAETVFEQFGHSVHVKSLLDGHSPQHHRGYEVDLEAPVDMAKDIAADLQFALLDSFVVRPDGACIHVVFTHA